MTVTDQYRSEQEKSVAQRMKEMLDGLLEREKAALANLAAIRAEIASVAGLIPRRRKSRAKATKA